MTAAVLAGVALMVSPFALHLSRAGANWGHATLTMFWSGLLVVVLALTSWWLWQRDLAGQVRAAHERMAPPVVEPEENSLTAEAETEVADNWERELAKLAEAVLEDLRSEQAQSGDHYRAEELEKVASTLLRDLPETKSSRLGSERGGR